SAYISTFHALCARILRENWLLAGVPPHFAVMGEIAAEILLEKSIEETIDARLDGDDTEITALLAYYSRSGLAANILAWLPALQASGASLAELANTAPEKILQNIQRYNASHLAKVAAQIQKLADTLGAADGAVGKKCQALRSLGQIAAQNLAEVERTLNGLGRGIKITQRTETFGTLEKIKNICTENKVYFTADTDGQEKTFADLSAGILKLLTEIQASYAEAKRRRGQLDYEALQLQTLNLLKTRAEIAAHYQNYFQAAFVDEYQDTNPVQTALIALLTKPENLFIVGDWKQSIYLFRYADVSLFQAKIQEAQERQEQGLGLRQSLRTNYRSAPPLIALVNRLCGRLLAVDEDSGYRRENDDLAAGRPELDGAAEITFIETAEDENSWQTRVKEARHLAQKIQELRNAKEFSEDNTCAVLLPTFSHVQTFAEALGGAEIKYAIVGGRNYYNRREVVDILNFLSILSNPYDDFQLAAVLRSELVNLSDDALLWLTRNKPARQARLFELLRNRNPHLLTAADEAKLQRFLDTYDELYRCIGKLSVARLLQLAFEKTLALRLALTHRAEAVKLTANLQKLLEIANGFARQSLPYFISYIEKLRLKEAREEEADLSDAASVKIMTIHGAKGLEFDNLFLADITGNKGKSRHNLLFNLELAAAGIPLALSYSDAENNRVISLAYAHAQRLRENLELRESRRLFYVALTRAKTRLFMTV
ncbi:superfamily I DNA or RNA helicase, partial [Candidatus Termititenax persephonae]